MRTNRLNRKTGAPSFSFSLSEEPSCHSFPDCFWVSFLFADRALVKQAILPPPLGHDLSLECAASYTVPAMSACRLTSRSAFSTRKLVVLAVVWDAKCWDS
jgi:hypothetical protein